MYRFKSEFKDVRIVIKRPQKMVITDQLLRQNQHLASFIIDDPNYNQAYGHNLEWVGEGQAPQRKVSSGAPLEIEVNVKKKEVGTSTSTAPKTEEKDLKQSAPVKQDLMSDDLPVSKHPKKQRGSAEKKPGVSGATGK